MSCSRQMVVVDIKDPGTCYRPRSGKMQRDAGLDVSQLILISTQ